MSSHKYLLVLAIAGALAAVGLWAGGVDAAGHSPDGQQRAHQHARSGECPMQARGECPMQTGGECPMKAHGAGALAYEQTPKLAEALAAVGKAEQAVQAGRSEEALKALAEAKELLEESHQALSEHVPPVVNERCPVMGNPIDPENLSAENTRLYRGKRVGFCCPACPAKWDEMSDEEKQEALKEAGAAGADAKEEAAVVNDRCPIMGTPIDPQDVPEELTREYQGRKIGFCCGGCPRAWDRLSDEQKQDKLDNLLSAVD
ncbi:MAG: hypothetical protein ACP5HU_13400 [Phycisphaerae bacterium]